MRSIVMTGGTAGIGLAASRQIQRTPNVRLLLGVRGHAPPGTESYPLDLAQLASVRHFAADVETWLNGASLDGLVLNAGVQVSNARQRTIEGFETTFAVNHLAHYLLLRLLMPRLAAGAIVIVTTSNLHDPRTNPIAPPEHANAKELVRGQAALSESDGWRSGSRAYAASKLCNLLTARALALSAVAQEKGLRVVAFNPGLTPGTHLTRNHPFGFKLIFRIIMQVLSRRQTMNTIAGGGTFLADLALGAITQPEGHVYASQVKRALQWPDISELARNDVVMKKLWQDSAALLGLSEDFDEASPSVTSL